MSQQPSQKTFPAKTFPSAVCGSDDLQVSYPEHMEDTRILDSLSTLSDTALVGFMSSCEVTPSTSEQQKQHDEKLKKWSTRASYNYEHRFDKLTDEQRRKIKVRDDERKAKVEQSKARRLERAKERRTRVITERRALLEKTCFKNLRDMKKHFMKSKVDGVTMSTKMLYEFLVLWSKCNELVIFTVLTMMVLRGELMYSEYVEPAVKPSEPEDPMDDLIRDYDEYLKESVEVPCDEYGDEEMNRIISEYEERDEGWSDDEDFTLLVNGYYDDQSSDDERDTSDDDARLPAANMELPFKRPDPSAMLWQDGEEPELIERFDADVLRKIHDNFNELIACGRLKAKTKTIDLFPKFVSAAKGGDEFKVKYVQKDGGRFYAKKSLSMGCMQKQIRGALCQGQLDADIVNCHPSIAYNLCVQNSIPCPLLSRYVNDRDAFIKSIRIQDGEEPVTKTTITGMLNGQACKNRGLADMKKEFKLIIDRVFKLFPQMNTMVPSDETNRRVKVCSRIWMMIESCLQRVAMKVFQDAGFVVRVSVYDGFMVDKNDMLDPDVVMRNCEIEIFKQTGYRIRFIIKPFSPIDFEGFVPNPVTTYQPRKRDLGVYSKYKPIIHDDLQVQPFSMLQLNKMTFGPGIKVVGICAPMGSGKSHQVRECIKMLSKRKPDFKCLDVSSRRTQGEASRSSMNEDGHGFVSYRDCDFEADRLTIQFESLFKLPVDQVYDLVIFDEIRSILDCATSTTNQDNWESNITAFRNLMVSTKQIVLCDADMLLDDAVSVMLDEMFPDPACISMHIYPKTRSGYIKTVVLQNRDDFTSKLRHDMRTGKKVGVVCPLRKSVQFIDQMAQDEHVSVKYFHGLSDEGDKAECWANPNELFLDTQVVVFNSTVTVGNDIQIEFDELYVLADSPHGCNFRQLTQMMGRFRKLKSKEIRVSLFGGKTDYVSCLTDDQLRERDKQKVEFRLDGMFERRAHHISHFRLERGDEGAKWCPDWVIQVRAYNEVLSAKSTFKSRFIEHQLFRGMTVINITGGDDDVERNVDMSQVIAELTTAETELALYRKILETSGSEARLLELAQIRDKRKLKEDEVITVDMWKTIKDFVFKDVDTNKLRLPDCNILETEGEVELSELNFIRRHTIELKRLLGLLDGQQDHLQSTSFSDQSGTMLYRGAVISLLQKLTGSQSTDITEIINSKHAVLQDKIIEAVDTARVLGQLAGLGEPRVRTDDPVKKSIGYVKHVLKCLCLDVKVMTKKRTGKGERTWMYSLEIVDQATEIVSLAMNKSYILE